MIDVEKARQRILDLAIRGKLVPQDPNDEPASVLLERIREEQIKLHREGIIKKLPEFSYIYRGSDNRYYEKNGHAVSELSDLTFDLPIGWCALSLDKIATFGGGKTPSTYNRDFWGGDVNWTTSKDVKSKYLTGSQTTLSDEGAQDLQLYPEGTLVLVTRSGILRHSVPISILRVPSTVNQDIKTISPYLACLSEWIYLFFKAMEKAILRDCSKDGTTVESLDFEKVKRLSIPIPPENELRKILQKQNTANELLAAIGFLNSEISGLCEKLKKKALSAIFSSDKSYYRPLSEIGAIVGGGTPKTDTPEYWGGDIAWIGPADMGKYKEKYIKTVSRYITAEGLAHSGAVLMPKGSVIMSSRAPIGYLGIATCPICTSQGCKSVVPHDIRDSEYIYYALSALVDKLKNVGKGTTFNEISGKVLARQSISWPKQEDRKKAVCLMTALNEIIRSLTTNS